DVIGLRNVLKHAVDEGWIKVLPTQNMRPMKSAVEKRPLFSCDDLESLCNAALAKKKDGEPVTKNGQQFADYIRLMAYSGARRNEALALQWSDVDTVKGQLTIARQITPRGIEALKNSEARTVDFNAKLRAHIE